MAEEEKKTVKKATKKAAAATETPVEEAPKKATKTKKAAKAVSKVEKKEAKRAAAKEAKKANKVTPTEATAFARDVRITPRKVRLVADLVRGKDVKDALAILTGVTRVGAGPVEKIIRYASANAVNNYGMDKDALYVAEIQVSDGLKIKRFIPRAKGSASGIIKRNANIRISVKERK